MVITTDSGDHMQYLSSVNRLTKADSDVTCLLQIKLIIQCIQSYGNGTCDGLYNIPQ